MSELLHIFSALESGQAGVLATLVKVEGSSYRRPGARLLWREHAARIGSISGGCLEDDLAEHCRRVHTTGRSQTVVYDTTRENDLVWGVGLGCNGVVHVLVQPIEQVRPLLAFVVGCWAKRKAVAAITMIQANAPGPNGTLFALDESGEAWSPTDAPGENESLRLLAGQCLHARRSSIQRFNATTQDGPSEVFVEYLPPPVALTIIGAGDDARPLARMAATLGWMVAVYDPRPAYATKARFPEAHAVAAVSSAEAGANTPADTRSAAVVMTHHYVHDLPAVRALLPKGLPYLGLLGPKKRAARILDEIVRSGFPVTPATREHLHAPVGLDLGAATPEAVALSILAEIQACLHAGNARPLRERNGPIHHD